MVGVVVDFLGGVVRASGDRAFFCPLPWGVSGPETACTAFWGAGRGSVVSGGRGTTGSG